MNTRQAIQPSSQPPLLSLSLSSSRNRFIAATAEGLRCFRIDNCLTTYQPQLPTDGSVAIAEQHDDRYLAYVGGGRAPAEKSSIVVFWDAVVGREVTRFDFHEAVLGIRLNPKWMVVVLKDRTIVFEYQRLEAKWLPTPPPEIADDQAREEDTQERIIGPNAATALWPTCENVHGLAVLRNDLLALPAQTLGQVQLIPLQGGSKRILKAHQSSIRQLAVSDDGTLIATASEQGTLIRVYKLSNLDQLTEFRRGSDHAIIFHLAFSPGNRWLACTSDKGTLHIFDLRPPNPEEVAAAREKQAREERQAQHRKSQSYAGHRLSGTALEKDSLSGFSGRSSPMSRPGSGGPSYQGSVQEYYGLRPVPASASPPATGLPVSAMAAFKASPFAPRILKDVRSVVSAPFYMGNDPPHWQGGPAHSWTTAPNGTKKRVKNPVLPLPNDPSGRPPKGVLAFAPKKGESDDEGAKLYVIGGGSDARWEMFELLPAEGGGWALVNRGFRRYLTRQFVD